MTNWYVVKTNVEVISLQDLIPVELMLMMSEENKVKVVSLRIMDQAQGCIDMVANLKTDRVQLIMKPGPKKNG